MFLFCFQYTLMTKHCRWKPVGKKTEFSMKSRSLSPCYYTKGALIHTDVCLRPAALVAAAPRWGKPHTPGHRLGNTNALEQEKRQHGFWGSSRKVRETNREEPNEHKEETVISVAISKEDRPKFCVNLQNKV